MAVIGLAAAFLLPSPGIAWGQTEGGAALRRDLDVERRLLRDDLAALALARQTQATAQEAVSQVAQDLAAQTAVGADPQAIGALREPLAAAAADLATASSRVAARLTSIEQSVRRIALLGELLRTAPAAAVPDVLSGRWQVTIQPGDLTGTFELRQDATQISGTYGLGSDRAGSLRGSFAGGRLRLERVDSKTGLDSIFEAVMPAPGQLRGTWHPTILSSGGPGGGDWTAALLVEAPSAGSGGGEAP